LKALGIQHLRLKYNIIENATLQHDKFLVDQTCHIIKEGEQYQIINGLITDSFSFSVSLKFLAADCITLIPDYSSIQRTLQPGHAQRLSSINMARRHARSELNPLLGTTSRRTTGRRRPQKKDAECFRLVSVPWRGKNCKQVTPGNARCDVF
jgi:hypothetical protein